MYVSIKKNDDTKENRQSQIFIILQNNFTLKK